MDAKISAFPVLAAPSALDLIPVVAGGINQVVTLGVMSNNMPNIGNKGITVNATTSPTTFAIPLNKTLIKIGTQGAYTLADGSDGQEMTIVSIVNLVTLTANTSTFTSATFTTTGVLKLLFLTGIGWTVVSKEKVTVA